MWILVAALLAQVPAALPPIGVAVTPPDSETCIAMPGPALQAGTMVTLVQPSAPQAVVTAVIQRAVPPCLVNQGDVAGTYYAARLDNKAAPSHRGPWIAIRGNVETRRSAVGAVVVQAGQDYPDAQMRSCTSSEGLHLTVWSGIPLESRRLWHQYYYLGYDTEPTCDERDWRDTAG